MLYALAHPAALLVLLVSFVVGITLHGWAAGFAARRLTGTGHREANRPDPRLHLDPFGVVAASISGIGWARPRDLPDPRRRAACVVAGLIGPAVNVGLGLGLLVLWRVAYGPVDLLRGDSLIPALARLQGGSYLLQHGVSFAGAAASSALFLVGLSQLYLGALSLVPLPPLDGGRLLLALGPRSTGWQQARYHLVERNIGIAVLLALLLIPLGDGRPLLPRLLDIVLTPVISGICGG